jgi:hypothetical protein
MNFKLGLNHKPIRLTTPALSDFTTPAATWPPVKPWGWENALPASQLAMLGNDKYGDCVPVAALHYAQNETANTGNPLTPTTDQALSLYTALTGWDPNDPATDQGTDPETLLAYWKSTGIPINNAGGKEVLHKITGWATLDITSWAQLRYAAYTFGGLFLAINCPQSALDNTKDWNYVPGSPNVGGHGINMTGQGSLGCKINSWGLSIPATQEFLRQKLVSAFAVITPQWLNQQGKSPSGLDLNGLTTAMKAL